MDNDCDPETLEEGDVDEDADGVLVCAGDCDDTSAEIYLGADEVCGDEIDQDCNGAEEAVGTDPRCWEESRLGCGNSVAGTRSQKGSFALLLLFFVALGGLRRRTPVARGHAAERQELDGRRAALPLLLSLLIAGPCLLGTPSESQAATSRSVEEIRSDIKAGRCDTAQLEARLLVQSHTDVAENHKLLGDAARCANDPREALVSYRAYLALGGKDPSITSILPSLSSLLATVAVTVPLPDGHPPPSVHVVVGDDVAEGILDTTGIGVVPDVRTGVPVVLVVHGPGWEPSRTAIDSLASAEVRPVNVTPNWVGKATLTLTDFDHTKLEATLTTPIGAQVLEPNSTREITAGDVSLQVSNSMGLQAVNIPLPAGSNFEFNPASWAAAELRIAGLPVGSEVRVFVEGHDGTFMERAGQAAEEGELNEESGIILSPPVVLQSLVSGAGGLFVNHPLLGEGLGQVVLAPGVSNSATFKWQEMPGVAGVGRAWTEWHGLRLKHERLRKKGKIAGIAVAVGSGVASGILWALAAGSSATANQSRKDAVVAGDQGDIAQMEELFEQHQSALSQELAFSVGGGIAAGIAGTGLGITLAFDQIGKKKIAEHGEWSMRIPEEAEAKPEATPPEEPATTKEQAAPEENSEVPPDEAATDSAEPTEEEPPAEVDPPTPAP